MFVVVERAIVLTCLALTLHAWRTECLNQFKQRYLRRYYFDFGRSVFLAVSAEQAEVKAGRLARFANC